MNRQNTPLVSKEDWVKRVKEKYPQEQWGSEIARYQELYGRRKAPKGMEYLEGDDMYGYLCDMVVAQIYADFNRKVMMDEIIEVMQKFGLEYDYDWEEVMTVHNFIDFDDWIIRKGAVRSYEGEKFILPFNMKEGLLICEGKSNPEWNYSAPHGAGRVMSRSEAKRKLRQSDAEKQMEGIYSSNIPLDEAPDAYKDAEIIEICIEPTANIVDRIKPVMNMKSG